MVLVISILLILFTLPGTVNAQTPAEVEILHRNLVWDYRSSWQVDSTPTQPPALDIARLGCDWALTLIYPIDTVAEDSFYYRPVSGYIQVGDSLFELTDWSQVANMKIYNHVKQKLTANQMAVNKVWLLNLKQLPAWCYYLLQQPQPVPVVLRFQPEKQSKLDLTLNPDWVVRLQRNLILKDECWN